MFINTSPTNTHPITNTVIKTLSYKNGLVTKSAMI